MAGNVTVLERKTFPPGARIFKEGDEGNRAYVVQQGMIEIAKLVNNEEVVLGTVTEGGIFGEMALIDDQPRMASARAIKGTTLIIITREMFMQKLAKSDPFIRGLLNIFTKHIRSLAKQAK